MRVLRTELYDGHYHCECVATLRTFRIRMRWEHTHVPGLDIAEVGYARAGPSGPLRPSRRLTRLI